MAPEDDKYEGKSVRDIVIGLDKDMKFIKKQLFGNGQQGLVDRVRTNEFAILKHTVYFSILGAAITFIGLCVAGWIH